MVLVLDLKGKRDDDGDECLLFLSMYLGSSSSWVVSSSKKKTSSSPKPQPPPSPPLFFVFIPLSLSEMLKSGFEVMGCAERERERERERD